MSYKEIADPVHGLIRLTAVEAKILASKAMQRLHHVKQLGLAHMVFPGANYSRHAHSLGACHNAGRMLEAVKRNNGSNFSGLADETIQKYRIVALLHDVGHYPFSHATEEVIKEYYGFTANSNSIISTIEATASTSAPDTDSSQPTYLKHEPLGEFIIRNDPQIGGVLREYSIDPDEIADIFTMKKPEYNLTGIFSSDLDCDRLDYLRRTAHNSGAPYGSVDINFLIDQAVTDKNGVFCYRPKAARAADHLLVSRFYDYMQVPFNKTAVALEWSLVCCLNALFKVGNLDCSRNHVCSMVSDGSWAHFDDQAVISKFRELQADSSTIDIVRDHLEAILHRKSARFVASWEKIRYFEQAKDHKKDCNHIRLIVDRFARSKGIDSGRIYVWDTPVHITKYNLGGSANSDNPEYYAGAVQILDKVTNEARRLFLRQDLLLSRLCGTFLSGLRVYYLPSASENAADVESIISDLTAYLSCEFESPTYT